jgi:CRISPR/Cas system-associated endonuclease Cas3-HD
MNYTETQIKDILVNASSKKITAPSRESLLVLVFVLVDFLYKWFLTPTGERKPFVKALLVALYKEFWTDLYGLKSKLDYAISKL